MKRLMKRLLYTKAGRRENFEKEHENTLRGISVLQDSLEQNRKAQKQLRDQMAADPGLEGPTKVQLKHREQRRQELKGRMLAIASGQCGEHQVGDCAADTSDVAESECGDYFVARPGKDGKSMHMRPCVAAYGKDRTNYRRCSEGKSECIDPNRGLVRVGDPRMGHYWVDTATGERDWYRKPLAAARYRRAAEAAHAAHAARLRASRPSSEVGARRAGARRKSPARGGTGTPTSRALSKMTRRVQSGLRVLDKSGAGHGVGAGWLTPGVVSSVLRNKDSRARLHDDYVSPFVRRFAVGNLNDCGKLRVNDCAKEAELGACGLYSMPTRKVNRRQLCKTGEHGCVPSRQTCKSGGTRRHRRRRPRRSRTRRRRRPRRSRTRGRKRPRRSRTRRRKRNA